MYLYYADTYFQLSVSAEDYSEENNNLFKQLYLKFNFQTKSWLIESKKIEEVMLWFEKYNIEYVIQDSAKEKLQEIRNEYQRETYFFRNIEFDESILNKDVKPYEFQREWIKWRLQRSNYLDSHAPGTGKTFSNICVFSQRYKQNLCDGIIILVPVGLSYHWKEQILQFSNTFIEDDIQIINNENKIKPFENYKDKKILIIRHDLLADVLCSYRKDYKSLKSLKTIRWSKADFVDIKKEWNKNDLQIVVDEAHSFKRTDSIKTKALFSIKKYFKYRAELSATFCINYFEDIYSPLYFADKSIIKMNENSFRIWLADSIGNKWNKYAINKYNTENIQKVMHDYRHVFTQIRKEDIEEIKVRNIIKDIKCELTKEQKILFQEIIEKEISILEDEYNSITWRLLLTKIHLLLEVFDNPLLLQKRQYDNIKINSILNKWTMEDDPKFIYLKTRLNDIINEQNKKVIIYDFHPDTIESLAYSLKKYNPLFIHGKIKTKNKELDRKEKENLFNFDKEHKLIILSSMTSSQGINLQYGASNIIFYSLPWDATLFKQGSERTNRVNSVSDSETEILYYNKSLDNLRYLKCMNRIELNSKMDMELTQNDLNRLLNGKYN